MKTTPDDFNDLKVLLAWKRHETPPPAFFEEFPQKVMARLRLLQTTESLPWWRRWWDAFELQPILAGAYSVLVCGLLLFGIGLSQILHEERAAASDYTFSESVMVPPVIGLNPTPYAESRDNGDIVLAVANERLTDWSQSSLRFNGMGIKAEPSLFKTIHR